MAGPISIESENIQKPDKRVKSFLLNSTQFVPKKIIQFETRIKEEEIDDDYTQRDAEDLGKNDDGGDDDF